MGRLKGPRQTIVFLQGGYWGAGGGQRGRRKEKKNYILWSKQQNYLRKQPHKNKQMSSRGKTPGVAI